MYIITASMRFVDTRTIYQYTWIYFLQGCLTDTKVSSDYLRLRGAIIKNVYIIWIQLEFAYKRNNTTHNDTACIVLAGIVC